MALLYKDITDCYKRLEQTTKRLEKIYHIAQLLKKCETAELDSVTLLLQGRVFPVWSQYKIGVAARIVIKALSQSTGNSVQTIESVWQKTGDLGLAVADVIEQKKQSTLGSFMAVSQQGKTIAGLTLEKVYKTLQKLASQDGSGTMSRRVQLIADLLTSATPTEARFIARTVVGELRTGAAEGVLRDAIVHAFFPPIIGISSVCPSCHEVIPAASPCPSCLAKIEKKENSFANIQKRYIELFPYDEDAPETSDILIVHDLSDVYDLKRYKAIMPDTEYFARECYSYIVDSIQRAYDFVNDFGTVATKAKTKGLHGVRSITLVSGKPVKAMLYLKAADIKTAFESLKTPAAVEYKYDGFRVQIHVKDGNVQLFTRRLDDITKQFPDVVKAIQQDILASDDAHPITSCIFDAEIVGIDPETKKSIPFQKISQRIKRVHNIHEMMTQVPVTVHVFDVLLLNDTMYLDTELSERRALIEQVIDNKSETVVCATQLVTDDLDKANAFYQKSLSLGFEGIMVKSLDAPYKPGARVGYGMKVKPIMETLDLVITRAEWGEGKRSEWLSSFILSCQDDDGNLYEIGRVGTGIKEIGSENEQELSFENITNMLVPLIKGDKDAKVVEVEPQIVLEVAYEELQASTTYGSGYALRFPRVVQIRMDKPVSEISDLAYIKDLYTNQRGRNDTTDE
jgi:ATP-dependent DNA ligase I